MAIGAIGWGMVLGTIVSSLSLLAMCLLDASMCFIHVPVTRSTFAARHTVL